MDKGKDESVIAVANWTDQDQETFIEVDWQNLGIDPAEFNLFIPEIKNYQLEQRSVLLKKLIIPAKKGFLILLKRK